MSNSLEGRVLKLPSGRSIDLQKELAFTATTASIAASPSGDRVALVWDTHSCMDRCGGGMHTVGAHRIVLVDTSTGAADKIAEGTGVGAVRFDPTGRMFVQRDRRTYEWSESPSPLPDGVFLVAPVVPEQHVQCCGF